MIDDWKLKEMFATTTHAVFVVFCFWDLSNLWATIASFTLIFTSNGRSVKKNEHNQCQVILFQADFSSSRVFSGPKIRSLVWTNEMRL